MPPRPPADARERLLDAALRLVGERGLGAVSNRTVARAAGVSLGTLTYHFPSQEELLREALLRFVAGEADRLGALAAEVAAGGDPAAAAGAVQELLSRESASRLAKLELYLYAARRPGLQEAAARCFAAYEAVVAAAFSALGVPDAERLAPTAVAVIDGLQLRRLAVGGREELPVAEALLAIAGRDLAADGR